MAARSRPRCSTRAQARRRRERSTGRRRAAAGGASRATGPRVSVAHRRARPAAGGAPFVPAVAGVGRQHRPLRLRAAADARGHGPIRRDAARAGEALHLERPADSFPQTRSHARLADRLAPRPRGRRRLARAPTSSTTSTASAGARSSCASLDATAADPGARAPLPPGRYSFVATHEGMFGGRDFTYLEVVPAGSPVTAISSRPARDGARRARRPAAALRALVALAFAVLLLRSFRRRRSGEKVLWAAGFAPLRSRRRLRGRCAAGRLDPRPLPGLLPRGRRAHRCATSEPARPGCSCPRRGRDLLLGGSPWRRPRRASRWRSRR